MSGAGRSGQPDYSGTVLGPRMVPATYERRTIVLNDSKIAAGAPPSNRSADDYGKFFPRGMRGTLEEIRIYALGDGADTVTLNISPYPGLGPTYTAIITPPAAWGWVDAAFNVMWNYDSLYVWLSDIEANVDWGYDEVKPYDGHLTADLGVTFTDVDERPFIRIVMTGETAGDVPVSGTLNTIEVPAVGGVYDIDVTSCADGVITSLLTFHGAGTLTMARIRGFPFVVPNHYTVYYQLTIFADGRRALTVDNLDLTQSPVAVAGRSSIGEFFNYTSAGAVEFMVMNVRVPIKFRRSLWLRFRQKTGANMEIVGELYINAQR